MLKLLPLRLGQDFGIRSLNVLRLKSTTQFLEKLDSEELFDVESLEMLNDDCKGKLPRVDILSLGLDIVLIQIYYNHLHI